MRVAGLAIMWGVSATQQSRRKSLGHYTCGRIALPHQRDHDLGHVALVPSLWVGSVVYVPGPGIERRGHADQPVTVVSARFLDFLEPVAVPPGCVPATR